jgi:catechol 2,3-dioxygenase-like lactoylglutathione lyase family enzyme
MMTTTPRLVTFGLATTALVGTLFRQAAGRPSDDAVPALQLVNTCLITADVQRLVRFYEPILSMQAVWSGQDYAEFRTGVGVLAIFSSAAQEKYIPGAAEPGKNRSAILEFRVSDVDSQYTRLQGLVKTWVKPPTTQPWGTRSVYFRDPDGNLVDLYVPPRY